MSQGLPGWRHGTVVSLSDRYGFLRTTEGDDIYFRSELLRRAGVMLRHGTMVEFLTGLQADGRPVVRQVRAALGPA